MNINPDDDEDEDADADDDFLERYTHTQMIVLYTLHRYPWNMPWVLDRYFSFKSNGRRIQKLCLSPWYARWDVLQCTLFTFALPSHYPPCFSFFFSFFFSFCKKPSVFRIKCQVFNRALPESRCPSFSVSCICAFASSSHKCNHEWL